MARVAAALVLQAAFVLLAFGWRTYPRANNQLLQPQPEQVAALQLFARD